MPQLGIIEWRKDITGKGHDKVIWAACEVCGKERWVTCKELKQGGKPISLKCQKCVKGRGEANPHWNGGRYKASNGYVQIRLQPDDFFYPMAMSAGGYVAEHRLVMARHLSRCLLAWETVHHKNGVRDDNRLTNLELLPTSHYHNALSSVQKYIKKLEDKIIFLEGEIAKNSNKAY